MRNGQEWTVTAIAWFARIAGATAILVVLIPWWHLPHSPVSSWLGLHHRIHQAAVVATMVAGVGLVSLATGLRRRKRRAWQVAVGLTSAVAAQQLLVHHHLPGLVIAGVLLALLAVLLVNRRHFVAVPDPAVGRWYAGRIFARFALAGIVVDVVLLTLGRHRIAGTPSLAELVWHSTLALGGISGPLRFLSPPLDDLTAVTGLVFGVTAAVLGAYFLLRSAEPAPAMDAGDRQRVRALLTEFGGRDSLAYFALRADKSVVVSPTGKAAVTYRALAGVALASGDPLGDPEAWPGAITEYLRVCARFGWVPAVLGCSERGATVWARHGLQVLELGDEAVVDATRFTLAGRAMRDARQMAARARKAGYAVTVRAVRAVPDGERAALAQAARRWRGTEPDRGFSMALGRTADERDPDCVLVTAARDGQVRGVLQFVPWGGDGLSLDLMRRDRGCPDSGINELMITELLARAPELGVRRVSLNFAVFRSALARAERIGAGPVARLWARLLRLGSRWWQIESLYRFTAKFRPAWVPRFVAYSAARELPRIVLAALEAEGFGGRPGLLQRARRLAPVAAPRPVPGGDRTPAPAAR